MAVTLLRAHGTSMPQALHPKASASSRKTRDNGTWGLQRRKTQAVFCFAGDFRRDFRDFRLPGLLHAFMWGSPVFAWLDSLPNTKPSQAKA